MRVHISRGCALLLSILKTASSSNDKPYIVYILHSENESSAFCAVVFIHDYTASKYKKRKTAINKIPHVT